VVFEKGLERPLSELGEEEGVDPWAKFLECDVTRCKESSTSMCSAIECIL